MMRVTIAVVALAAAGCGAIVGVEEASPAVVTGSAGPASGVGGTEEVSAASSGGNSGGGGGAGNGGGPSESACPDGANLVAHYRADDLRLGMGESVTLWPSSAKPYSLVEAPDFGNAPRDAGGSAPVIEEFPGHHSVRFTIVDPEPIPPAGKALLGTIPPAEFSAESDPTQSELTLVAVVRYSGVEYNDQPLTALHYGEPPGNLPGLKLVVADGTWRFELRYGGRVFPSTPSLPGNDVQSIVGSAATTNWTVLSARKRIDSFSFRVDGTQFGDKPMKHPTLAITEPHLLVGTSNGYQHFDGEIAEIVMYRGALDDEAIEHIEGCLGTRYAIPIAAH